MRPGRSFECTYEYVPASCGTPCGGGHAAGEAGAVDVGVVEGDQGAAAAASRPRGPVNGSCNRTQSSLVERFFFDRAKF